MDQFKALFGSARIPKADQKDVVEVDPDSRHVAVLVRNQFYYFAVVPIALLLHRLPCR